MPDRFRRTTDCQPWWTPWRRPAWWRAGAARRAIAEGGAYVNNVKVTDPAARLDASDVLADGLVVVRRGRRTVGAVRVG